MRASLLRACGIAAAVLSIACHRAETHPVLPLSAVFDSPDDVQLQAEASDSGAALEPCRIRRFRAAVDSVRGDTLHLSGIEVLRQPRGAPRCESLAVARMSIARNPELRTMTGARSGGLFALGVLFLGAWLLGMLFATLQGGYT